MFNITQHYGVSNFATNKETRIVSIPSTGLEGYRYPSQFNRIWTIGKTNHIPSYTPHLVTLFDLFQFHKVTAGQYLTESKSLDVIKRLLAEHPNLGKNKILGWGDQVTNYKCSVFVEISNLELFGDRIVNISVPKKDSPAYADLKRGGVKLSNVFKPFIDFVNSTTNFKYSRNIVNFLKSMIEVNWRDAELYGRYTFDENIANKIVVGRYFRIAQCPTERGMIDAFLAFYLSDYRQWFNGGTYVKIGNCDVYIDHHTVFESSDLVKYFKENSKYPNQLPFGIHPREYYAERINDLADVQYRTYHTVVYPEDFNGYVNLEGSSHRQIINGVGLVSEGRTMKHCVGGENYLDKISDGTSLFFHLNIPNSPTGGTLSMTPAKKLTTGTLMLNDTGWVVDQYYGFDDRELISDPNAMTVLEQFLEQHFIKHVMPAVEVNLPSANTKVKFVVPDSLGYPTHQDNQQTIDVDSFGGHRTVGGDILIPDHIYPQRTTALAGSISANTAMSVMERWMNLVTKEDIVGGIGVATMAGDIAIPGSHRGSISRELLNRKLNSVSELPLGMGKTRPFRVTHHRRSVNGVTHHFITPSEYGFIGKFHSEPSTLSFSFETPQFTGLDILGNWLEARGGPKVVLYPPGLKLVAKKQIEDRLQIVVDNEVVINTNPKNPTPQLKLKGRPFTVRLKEGGDSLSYLFLDFSITVVNERIEFEDFIRIKLGDIVHVDIDGPVRIKVDPVYSSRLTMTTHCVNLINKGI